ncbi:MAG TPA: hypothetical protein VK608_02845, partial [Edaphobacter sp.]|nr:hypothetical protein [Edaphobacter sp.]
MTKETAKFASRKSRKVADRVNAMNLGLVKYDAMVLAIEACERIDEVKSIIDKARALEVYAAQAMNTEAEAKAARIRIRAERKT